MKPGRRTFVFSLLASALAFFCWPLRSRVSAESPKALLELERIYFDPLHRHKRFRLVGLYGRTSRRIVAVEVEVDKIRTRATPMAQDHFRATYQYGFRPGDDANSDIYRIPMTVSGHTEVTLFQLDNPEHMRRLASLDLIFELTPEEYGHWFDCIGWLFCTDGVVARLCYADRGVFQAWEAARFRNPTLSAQV